MKVCQLIKQWKEEQMALCKIRPYYAQENSLLHSVSTLVHRPTQYFSPFERCHITDTMRLLDSR
jgi:hypothetical protein